MRLRNSTINSIVEEIYDASLGYTSWSSVLGSVSKITNSQDTCLQVWNIQGGNQTLLVNQSWQIPTDFLEEYAAEFSESDPRAAYVIENRMDVPVVFNDHAFINNRKIASHPYYDYLWTRGRLRYFSSTLVSDCDSNITAISLQRTPKQGVAGSEIEKLLGTLRGHFRRAQEISSTLASKPSWTDLALNFIELTPQPAMVVSLKRDVLAMNEKAEELLRLDNRISVKNNKLSVQSRKNGSLASAVYSCVFGEDSEKGGRLVIPSIGMQGPILLDIFPLCEGSGKSREPLVGISFRGSHSYGGRSMDGSILVELFGFSTAELRLAQALTEGLTLPQYAERVHISHHTARTHLKNAMRKVQVNSQVQLVAKLLRL